MGPYVSVYNMNLLCFTRWPGRVVHEEGTEVVASMALQRSFGTAPKVAVADASASASGRDGEASADSAESETPSAARRLRCAASQRFSDVDSARKTRKTRDAAPRVAFVWRPRRERPARLAMPREVGTDAFAMQIDMSAVREGTAEFVFRELPNRRLEDRVLDVVKVCHLATRTEGVDQLKVEFCCAGQDRTPDEIIIAEHLFASRLV